MTIIKPVTELLPYTNEILEQTSIPFSCTITPYAPIPSSDSSDTKTNKDDKKPLLKDNNKPNRLKHGELLPLSSIPKCGNCGSILNPQSPILDYPSKFKQVAGSFLCGLCGYETTFDPEMQLDYNYKSSKYNYSDRFEYISTKISNIGYYEGKDANNLLLKELLPECYSDMMEYELDDMNNKSKTNNILACPFLLIIVIHYSASQNNAQYYSSICEVLNEIMEQAPTFTKIGIFLSCPDNFLTVMDLSSAIPHWKQVSLKEEEGEAGNHPPEFASPISSTGFRHDQIFWLCKDDNSKHHIEAVLRALGDSLVIEGVASTNNTENEDEDDEDASERHRVEIGTTIETILNYIEESGGYHPGNTNVKTAAYDDDDDDDDDDPNHGDKVEGEWKYIGGKIFCFLNNPPKEIPNFETYGNVGTGGYGGTCSPVSQPKTTSESITQQQNTPTPSNLLKNSAAAASDSSRFSYLQRNNIMLTLSSQEDELYSIFTDLLSSADENSIVEYFTKIGSKCCTMALGIEVFGILTSSSSFANHYIQQEKNVFSQLEKKLILGFPLLRILSDRSGGSGPVLTYLNNTNQNSVVSPIDMLEGDGGTLPALIKEALQRCPWTRPCAFGGMLRIRTSPSFQIQKTVTDPNAVNASFYRSGGVIGPCCADEESDDLWHFGSCDVDTTLTFDLEIVGNGNMLCIADSAYTESHGDVELPSCIQTAFVYSAIVKKNGGTGEYYYYKKGYAISEDASDDAVADDEWIVVRRLRVFTKKFSIARDTEAFMLSLHPEVMGMVLYHKLFSMSTSIGFQETQTLAKDWLLSLLLCTYQSALQYFSSRHNNNSTSYNSLFSPNQRLLHIPGATLSPRDLLLAKGHPQLSSLPLIVYALLLTDSLRPLAYKQTNANNSKNSSGNTNGSNGSHNNKSAFYYPSIDARCAAASNIYCLNPSSFIKAIIPILSLYAFDRKANKLICLKKDDLDEKEHSFSLPRSKKVLLNLIKEEYDRMKNHDTSDKPNELVLVIDSSRQIVCYAYQNKNDKSSNEKEETKTESKTKKAVKKGAAAKASSPAPPPPIDIFQHPTITRLLETKLDQYKFPPPLHTTKSLFDDDYERYLDIFIEDMDIIDDDNVTTSNNINNANSMMNRLGLKQTDDTSSFDIWCNGISNLVQEEINSQNVMSNSSMML